MTGHGADVPEQTDLAALARTYARQIEAFDGLLDRLRAVPLGDAPLNLEGEGMDPRRD